MNKSFVAVMLVLSSMLVAGGWWIGNSLNRSMEAEAATLNAAQIQSPVMGGRCTLTSGAPVMNSGIAGATALFYTPYNSDRISLYNGSDLVAYEFSELSNSTTASSTGNAGPLSTTTSAVYDYFVWNNSGTLALTRGPAWTSTTTRSTGLSRTTPGGIYVNGTAITNGPAINRGTFVCTAVTDGSSQLNMKFNLSPAAGTTYAVLGVWNMYNRVMFSSGTVGDSTDSWTPQTAANFGPWNAKSGTSVVVARGLDEDFVNASSIGLCQANNTVRISLGIGLDSTSTFVGMLANYLDNNTLTNTRVPIPSSYVGQAGQGLHQIYAIEGANGTATCYGDVGAPTVVQTGLQVWMPL